jgi:hypothetical protein
VGKQAQSTCKESQFLRKGHGPKSDDRMLAQAVNLSNLQHNFLRTDQLSTAQFGNEPLPVLPTGVEVRTPPPNSPGIPVRAAPDCLVSQRPRPKEIGKSTGEINTQEASIAIFWLRDLVAALDDISFQLRECLASLPWNTWMNSSRCMSYSP